MRNKLRVAFIGLLALVFLGGIWSSFSAPRNLLDETPKDKSVTLVVDYGQQSNRELQTFELNGLISSIRGWELFKAARLPVEGTAQYPNGFVCRINGWPTKAEQDCQDTPSFREGHWAYYVTSSSLGSGWMLSGQGAAMHTPDCGGYEGWSWVEPGQESLEPRFEPTFRACK